MRKTLKVVASILIMAQININYVFAGKLFFKSEYKNNNSKIRAGYKLKFGKSYKNIEEKLNQATGGKYNFFEDNAELGAIAFAIILMLIFTAGIGGESARYSSSSGGGDEASEHESRLKEVSEEIKASPEVTEPGIPETNVPTEEELIEAES
jgi:hypothetical protein